VKYEIKKSVAEGRWEIVWVVKWCILKTLTITCRKLPLSLLVAAAVVVRVVVAATAALS
jgi:hypothetical protein